MDAHQKLVAAFEALKSLDDGERQAFFAWAKGGGRKPLRTLGITDAQIGPMILDVDLMDDAPLG